MCGGKQMDEIRLGKGRETATLSSCIAHDDRVDERRVCCCDMLARAV